MAAAVSGMRILLHDEHNARVHLCATVLVCVFAWWLQAAASDWLVLVIVMSLVWITEALNTAVENLCNKISPEHDLLIGKAKDVACLAVAIASVCAVISGLIVFIPLLRNL